VTPEFDSLRRALQPVTVSFTGFAAGDAQTQATARARAQLDALRGPAPAAGFVCGPCRAFFARPCYAN
jgi:hypothetical protein